MRMGFSIYVGCLTLKVKVAQLCLTFCEPMDHRVHGIKWGAFPFSRGSSQPGDRIQVSRISGGFFTSWSTTLGVWKEHRRQGQEQKIWTAIQEGVWMWWWEQWSSLQIVSTNSEIGSQVIAENEDGEKTWELWGEDSAGKSHLMMRVLGGRDGLGFWNWHHVMILWSVHGVQVLYLWAGCECWPREFPRVLRVRHDCGDWRLSDRWVTFSADSRWTSHWHVTHGIISH